MNENDFSMFSTARLKELMNLALRLGFMDDVAEYKAEIERRRKANSLL